jgi:dihydropteroate synthase
MAHSCRRPATLFCWSSANHENGSEAAVLAGVRRERIALDPGFGFGKSFEQNYPLLARFQELQSLGFPLLAGTSRKSFLGRMLAKDGKDAAPPDRLYGNLAAHTALILKGAHIYERTM